MHRKYIVTFSNNAEIEFDVVKISSLNMGAAYNNIIELFHDLQTIREVDKNHITVRDTETNSLIYEFRNMELSSVQIIEMSDATFIIYYCFNQLK